MLVTNNGMSIRFNEEDVRPMGRVAAGVRGIKLKGDDSVISMEVITPEEQKAGRQLMIIMENGYGKRTDIEEYLAQGRGGMGVKTAQVTAKTGKLVAGYIVEPKDKRDLLIVSKGGQVIRTAVTSVSVIGRATQGVRVMRFKQPGDLVATATLVGLVEEVVATEKEKTKKE